MTKTMKREYRAAEGRNSRRYMLLPTNFSYFEPVHSLAPSPCNPNEMCSSDAGLASAHSSPTDLDLREMHRRHQDWDWPSSLGTLEPCHAVAGHASNHPPLNGRQA